MKADKVGAALLVAEAGRGRPAAVVAKSGR